MSDLIDSSARIIWEYHHMNHKPVKSDCIFVLGSHDTRVAEYAADLFLQGFASLIIFSGGLGNLTAGIFEKTEAEIFSEIAQQKGVSARSILIEDKSSNTGENILFTKRLLEEHHIDCNTFIVVQKPYMERRAFATFKKLWPEKEIVIASPPISFDDYPTREIFREQVISIMVGDLQRIRLYPAKGFQIPQEIPDEVWNAYETLVKFGFTQHLVTV